MIQSQSLSLSVLFAFCISNVIAFNLAFKVRNKNAIPPSPKNMHVIQNATFLRSTLAPRRAQNLISLTWPINFKKQSQKRHWHRKKQFPWVIDFNEFLTNNIFLHLSYTTSAVRGRIKDPSLFHWVSDRCTRAPKLVLVSGKPCRKEFCFFLEALMALGLLKVVYFIKHF